jgi:putative ABC transport system ATP-binding protein
MTGIKEAPFLYCDNLVKIYKIADLEVVALQGLDLSVAKGDLMGIVGASGSGKSTLMNILGGLDRPTAGKVWVNGENLLALSDDALTRYRRTKVGFVWQQGARNLISYLTAQENVEIPMILSGRKAGEAHCRAAHLLKVVGLENRRQHHLQHLSGGEQQRVAIAVALANEPNLLLADEPTGELDTATSQVIYQLFRDLNQQMGLTTLIVSHDPGIARHVNRVIAIRDGRTSSETVRKQNGAKMLEHTEDTFEELVVLDSAGRLQVPKEFLERYHIRGRARLEPHTDGILIRSAPDGPVHEQHANLTSQTSRPEIKARGWQIWVNRLMSKKGKGGR